MKTAFRILAACMLIGVIGSFGGIEQGYFGFIRGIGQASIFLWLTVLSHLTAEKIGKRKRAIRVRTSYSSKQLINN